MRVVILFLLLLSIMGVTAQSNLALKYKYPVRINEILSWNESGIKDEAHEFEDWIELYNYGAKPLNLASLYFTDDRDNLTKWRLSYSNKEKTTVGSRKYMLLWMDGDESQSLLHSNFKLNKKGEFLAIVAPDGKTIIDSLTYPRQYVGVSYGRSLQDPRQFHYFDKPSPKASNRDGKVAISDKPKVSKKSGFYNASIKVELFGNKPQAIYYTLNGDDPTLESAKQYDGPILVDSSCVLKARVIEKNSIQSSVVHRTYLIRESFSLPTVSIIIDNKKLFDRWKGIFYGKNYKMKMSKIGFMEYYEEGVKVYSSNVKVKVHGTYSGSYPQKSLTINSASQQKGKKLRYPFFSSKPQIKKFQSIVLRNSGNDWLGTRMRDVLAHSIIDTSFVNLNYVASEPVNAFVNGQYWGMYNLREKMGKGFLRENHGVKEKDIDMLENVSKVLLGSKEDYEDLLNQVESMDLKDPSNYEKIKKRIDLENFIDYQVVQIILGNRDWPHNNVKYWRNNKTNSRWRWLLYDLDEAMKYPKMDPVALAIGKDEQRIEELDSVYLKSTLLLRSLMENNVFKRKFLIRMSEHLNVTFKYERVQAIIDSLSNMFRPHIEDHFNRWYPMLYLQKSDDGKLLSSAERDHLKQWENNLNSLKRYFENRHQSINDFILKNGLSKGVYSVSVKDVDPEEGVVKMANIYCVGKGYEGWYYKGSPVTVTAIPNEGYYFKGWLGTKKSKNAVLVIENDMELIPLFAPLP